MLDNTFAGMHQHGQYEIDFYLHSLTKFVSGHGDVMGGAVIARAELIRTLRPDFSTLGGVLDPHAAFLLQRGLKTYFVRYRAQCASAQRIAEFLSTHRGGGTYALPRSAGSSGTCAGARADERIRRRRELRSARRGDRRRGALPSNCSCSAMAASLGATDSLVMPPQLLGSRDLSDEQQRRVSGIAAGTVRLSIGLEDVDDLIEDHRSRR